MKRLFNLMVLFLVLQGTCHAITTIDINRGILSPVPIAIHSFNSDDMQLSSNLTNVIGADLERSGLFIKINPDAFMQKLSNINSKPEFQSWRVIKTQVLLNGEVQISGDQLTVNFKLYDVVLEKISEQLSISGPIREWRRIAHIVADVIYKTVTGEDPYFNTRIVYISQTASHKRRTTRLAIMDSDGENHKFLSSGNNIVITPRFSPNGHEIAYFAYPPKKSRSEGHIYILNLQTGKTRELAGFKGMTSAAKFSPDGSKLVLSFSPTRSAVSSIYSYDLRTGNRIRLTSGNWIDTSPSYSPDGRYIVFESDRSGSQQLYIMNADGSGVRRLSFGTGKYAAPVWSPKGDVIAFTRLTKGDFYIGVIHANGAGERMLASGYVVEGITWAPNGRVLMYMRQLRNGRTRLYSIDVTGYNEREVITPLDGAHPTWSPLIQ